MADEQQNNGNGGSGGPIITMAGGDPSDDHSHGPIAITTLACALGGIALIIAFFLPLLVFKPDRIEGFKERSDDLVQAIEHAEKLSEKLGGEISLEELRGLDPTRDNENISAERRGRLLERIAGMRDADEGATIKTEDIRNAREWIVTIRNVMFVPSLWHLFNVADRLEKDKERTLAFGERLGLDSHMLKVVSGVRVFLLSLPVAGLVAIAMALVTRFRKLNALFLTLLFLVGATLSGASGLLGGYGYACENPEILASVPAAQPLLRDLPFIIGPGTWAVLAGSLLFLFTAVFGVTRRNVAACYTFYLLLGAGVAVFWVYWIGEQRANPPAEGDPTGQPAGQPTGQPATPGQPGSQPGNQPQPDSSSADPDHGDAGDSGDDGDD